MKPCGHGFIHWEFDFNLIVLPQYKELQPQGGQNKIACHFQRIVKAEPEMKVLAQISSYIQHEASRFNCPEKYNVMALFGQE